MRSMLGRLCLLRAVRFLVASRLKARAPLSKSLFYLHSVRKLPRMKLPTKSVPSLVGLSCTLLLQASKFRAKSRFARGRTEVATNLTVHPVQECADTILGPTCRAATCGRRSTYPPCDERFLGPSVTDTF